MRSPSFVLCRKRFARAVTRLRGSSTARAAKSWDPMKHFCAPTREVREFNPIAVLTSSNAVPHFFPGVKVEVFHGFDAGKPRHIYIRGFFDLYCTTGARDTAGVHREVARAGPFRRERNGLAQTRSVHARTRLTRAAASALTAGDSVSLDVLAFVERSTDSLRQRFAKCRARGRWRWIVTLHPKSAPETVAKYQGLAKRASALRHRGQHPRPVPAGRHDDFGHLVRAQRIPADLQAGRDFQESPAGSAIDRHRLTGPAAACHRARPVAAAGADARASASTPTPSIRIATAARASACWTRSTNSSPPAPAIARPKPNNWWRKIKIRKRLSYWGPA